MEEKELQKSLHYIHDSASSLWRRESFPLFIWVELLSPCVIYFLFFTEIGLSIQYQRSYTILFSSLLKFILQIYYVVYAVRCRGSYHYIYVTEDKLVHCKGILTVFWETADISSIRSVKSHQSLVTGSGITAISSWKFPRRRLS